MRNDTELLSTTSSFIRSNIAYSNVVTGIASSGIISGHRFHQRVRRASHPLIIIDPSTWLKRAYSTDRDFWSKPGANQPLSQGFGEAAIFFINHSTICHSDRYSPPVSRVYEACIAKGSSAFNRCTYLCLVGLIFRLSKSHHYYT